MKPSERARRDAEAIEAFRNVFADLLNHAKFAKGEFFEPVMARDVDAPDWIAKRAAVASAAGRAAPAFSRWGGILTTRNAAFITKGIHLVVNWEMVLTNPSELPPERAVNMLDSAGAAARQAHDDAIERERGLTGLVAAFLRWPSDLADAVGPGRQAQQRAATVLGWAGQAVVAVVVTAALGLVASGVLRLFQLAFG